MSVICQTSELKYPLYLNRASRIATVEAQLRLPENYPSLANIIGGDFTIETPLVTVSEDQVVVSGIMKPHLLYHTAKPAVYREEIPSRDGEDEGREPDDDLEQQPAPTEYGVEWHDEQGVFFEEKIEFPGLRADMTVTARGTPAGSSYEMADGSRVHFRGRLEIEVEAVSIHSTTVVSDVTSLAPEKLNISRETVTVEDYSPLQHSSFPVQASLTLPKIKPGAARILKTAARPVAVSWEVNRGRIAVKGFVEISLAYVGCDDEGRPTEIFVNEWSRDNGTAIPFQTLMDNEFPEVNLVVSPWVTIGKMTASLSSPYELKFNLEMQAVVKVAVASPREVVTEVSSASGSLLDTQKNLLSIEEFAGEINGEIHLDQTLELPSGGPNLERILIHQVGISALEAEAATAKVIVQGNLDLWLFYMAEKADATAPMVAAWEKGAGTALPLNAIVDAPQIQAGAILQISGTVESLQVEMAGSHSVRVTGLVRVKVLARMARSCIVLRDCAVVSPVDPATRPSMLFYVVQPGDNLWRIARQYQTLTDTLARVNQIVDQERIYVGQKLLIPKQL